MNRNARWVWLVALAAVAGGASVLAFVLSLTGQSEGFYERNFVWLFWLNVAIGGLLVVFIGAALVRLALRQRRGKFGAQLLTKLAGIFTLVGLLPGLVIYTVSYQFVSRSILPGTIQLARRPTRSTCRPPSTVTSRWPPRWTPAFRWARACCSRWSTTPAPRRARPPIGWATSVRR